MGPRRLVAAGPLLALALGLFGPACAVPVTPPAAVAEPVTPAPGAAVPVTPAPVTSVPVMVKPVPVSVRIDAIGVASTLQPTGIAPDGTAEVPTDVDRVGWFTGAPPGPTVLMGHVDSRDGPAVFYRLRDLRTGDEIEVGTADGGRVRYRVERVQQVGKNEFPTFAVFGASREDVLRLVTCAGLFDRGARSYIDNLVVHATRA